MKKSLLAIFCFAALFLSSQAPAYAGQYGSPKKGVGGEYSSASSAVKVSWFYNWQHYSENSFKQGVQFIPMARVGRSESANCAGPWKYPDFSRYQDLVRNTAKNHPGSYWLIGNEPEIGDQDNIQPECAFGRYKAAMDFIRSQDATAKFIIGGFHLNPTRAGIGAHAPALLPLKNEPGFKGWHVHIYLDSRKDVAISVAEFDLMLRGVLELMQAGNAQGELWITEFLECYWGGSRNLNFANIKSLMQTIVPALESNPKVTRYAWYVLSEPAGQSWPFSLIDNKGAIKDLGQTYGSLATTDTPPYPQPGPKLTFLPGWNLTTKFLAKASDLPTQALALVRRLNGFWVSYIKNFVGQDFPLVANETYYLKAKGTFNID